MNRFLLTTLTIAAAGWLGLTAGPAVADLPKFDDVSKDYEKIEVSDQSKKKGLFTLWSKDKEAELIVELPKNYKGKSYFIALTVSSGDRYAGLQSGDWVVQFRRYDDRIAVIAPNLDVRATGDPESKASVKRLFTDRVLLDVPILAMGPSGGPVIDMDALLVNNVSEFFGRQVQLSRTSKIRRLQSAKVFPQNIEVAFEIVNRSNKLQTVYYSFSEVPSPSNGYKPRVADERVGYFTTQYSDLSKYDEEETQVRFINRWHLEKRDPKLTLSPPKEPIRFYVEHTTPVRYRRWIKSGVDYWNKAFEKVGLVDAIVVEYQDAQSGIHMEKDPEDVRYNFIRWLNNDIGTAIGPSRVHPETGEILDADIILTDGWIRHFKFNYEDLLPQLAMEGMSAETMAWLGSRPSWDPRVRLASPERANYLRAQYARQSAQPMAGHAVARVDSALIGDDKYDGLFGHVSQKNGYCMAASGRSLDLAMTRMNWQLALSAKDDVDNDRDDDDKDDEDKDGEEDKKVVDGEADKPQIDGESAEANDDAEDTAEDGEPDSDDVDNDDTDREEDESDESLVDGVPEWFVGPLLADLVAHEVGHTLGLRHNFKASAYLTLDDINSDQTKGKRTFAASVMDYIPINYRYQSGEVQGDYAMIDIGPYDFWAIEYGYTIGDKKLEKILSRCSEPALQYATDEDTGGPDPLARRYDFAADPLTYANEQIRLIDLYRGRILDKFVEEGDSWAKARRGYELTLMLQTRAASMMANWIGGAHVNRDKKGDPGDRPAVEVVDAQKQRDALAFVIEQTFRDQAYGLTPELLQRMGVDKWRGSRMFSTEATWPIHDRVLGLQASALTWVMNPTTLRRVYDNELRLPAETDALTLPELLATIGDAVWTELDTNCPEKKNDRQPMISSLRRNLQREHMQRLVDLVLEDDSDTAAYKPISNLARMQLRRLSGKIEVALKRCAENIDAYTEAHLVEVKQRIDRALSAEYTYNTTEPMGGGGMFFIFGEEPSNQSPR